MVATSKNIAAQNVAFTAVAVEAIVVAPTAAPEQSVDQRIALAVARAEKAITERLTAAHDAAVAAATNATAYAAKLARDAAAKHAASVQPDAAAPDMAMLDRLINNPPSGTRVLVGFILAIMASGAVGYGIGCLLSYALAGITVLVGPGLIAFMLTVASWIIAIYAAWKIGGWVGGKVFSSVVLPDGLAASSIDAVSNTFSSARSTVGGWFTSKPAPVVAAPAAPFSGAHTPA